MLNRKSCATVPFTPFEWTKARSLFNRTNLTEVMECVSMLTMWTNRMGDNTPVAIQCSRILLQARLSELRVQTVCESEKWLVIDELKSKHGHAITRCFLRAFTADGVLIMTPNQLKSMNIVTTKEDKTIDSKIQIFWEPIFRIIFDVKLGTEFVIALLWRLKDNEIIDSSSHQVLLYCRELIEHFIDSDHVAEKDWIRILDCLLSVASYFEPKLIESIMASIPKMSRKRRDQVRRIIKIQTTTKTIENDSSDIRTVEDLQKLLKKDRIATDKNEVLKDEAQSAALIEICDQEEDWSDIPFGLAPDQRIEVFSLVLDKEYLGQSLRNNSKKHKLEN